MGSTISLSVNNNILILNMVENYSIFMMNFQKKLLFLDN